MTDRKKPYDEESDEKVFFEIQGKLLGGTQMQRRVDHTKPYREVIERAKREVISYPRLDPKKAHRLEKALAPEGGLRLEMQGKKLNWISGLAAFCDHPADDVMTAITGRHSDLNTAIYEIACEVIDEYDADRSHDYEQHTDLAEKRGAYLARNLYVRDRDYLTTGFVSEVLRPYLAVMREAFRMLWKRIGKAHREGQFLIFSREGDGRFAMLYPGDGFDRRSTYEIPRKAYLEGFHLGEDDVDRSLIKSEPGNFDPLSLRFLAADQIPEFCLAEGSGSEKQKPAGRPKGINFNAEDAPLIEEMDDLIKTNQARSVTDAARQVFVRPLHKFERS